MGAQEAKEWCDGGAGVDLGRGVDRRPRGGGSGGLAGGPPTLSRPVGHEVTRLYRGPPRGRGAPPAPAGEPAGKGDGGDPDRRRLLDCRQRDGVVGQREGGGRLDRLRSHRRGCRTRRWMLWPAWMTQASPGWAWRTASGSTRGRSPIRALAEAGGPWESR